MSATGKVAETLLSLGIFAVADFAPLREIYLRALVRTHGDDTNNTLECRGTSLSSQLKSMNREDLKELAANPNFISGVYNYCDRWCERCALRSRCFVYATESADADLDGPDVSDLNNAKFWRKLHVIFKEAHELITQCAEEAGIDLNVINQDEVTQMRNEEDEARRNELSVRARDYAAMVESWLKTELVAAEQMSDDAQVEAKTAAIEIDAQDAFEVIRWYQFFIAAKVFRAVLGSDDELSGVYPNDDAGEANPAQTDANGSAKIALIAIERSLGAWRILQTSVPDKTDSIAPLMAALENLRSGIEETLPLARDFIRPGFDEVMTEFAS